ncbi:MULTISPECIES: nucleotide-binding protein [unclassified Methanoregula]|uniref:OB-fold nucleic acid binding domain-containing protein n=1 Tax=unclassified Methanoregula TaxID=2649730 RepID=UPI0009D232F5|nr:MULTISPECIES: nucleotide-binding protein [unclassified Methanoregula]OPX65385.1 MAG: hypothetical protein A4E33_00418 [Methanoregula sp. PtaB.Bin085]OPY32294.1 MAG: hypothetical protein A4E34_02668 [Methanoregula sp. PtaU1.Bin006]
MKIGSVDVRISILPIAAFIVFTSGFIIAAFFGPPEMADDVRKSLIWIIPALFLLLIIPAILNYMSRSQYADLEPEYEMKAKTVRVRLINESMIGKIVRIVGVVEQARYQFINRPQFTVADRSGSISVKMFTTPADDVKVNDIVEVYGQVIRRYIVTGEPVINCVIIRKTEQNG